MTVCCWYVSDIPVVPTAGSNHGLSQKVKRCWLLCTRPLFASSLSQLITQQPRVMEWTPALLTPAQRAQLTSVTPLVTIMCRALHFLYLPLLH